MPCALACGTLRRWPIGSTATPAAAWSWAAIQRHCGGSARCSPRERSRKIYWAVVDGRPPQGEGRVEAGLNKLTRGSGWRMVVDPAGQRAITDYRVLGAADGRAWLELRPRTGRTHQIRVHCAALGCPVVGDPVYGRGDDRPLLLHARADRRAALPGKAADRGHRSAAAAHARRARPARL